MGRLWIICFAAAALMGCGESVTGAKADAADEKPTAGTKQVTGAQGFPRCTDDVTVSPPEGECFEGDDYVCEVEARILALTNELRGDPTLAYSRQLTIAARSWSEGQADDGRISHDGFPDARYDSIRAAFDDLEVTIIAENVADIGATFKVEADQAAEMLTNGWWESPGHHKNMVANHTHIGIGVFYDGKGGVYATQLFGCE